MDTTKYEVPIVDISPFRSDRDSETRQRAAEDLAEKLRVNGCVGITGHGISAELLAEAFEVSRRLFDLPYEKKMLAPHPDGSVPHRGYSGTGCERGAAKTTLEEPDEGKKEEYSKMTDYKVGI